MIPRRTLLATSIAAAAIRPARAEDVQIDYWQYFFKERVAAMDALIAQFEIANPGIRVRHSHFPYAQYRTKVGAAVPAGEGPDVVQLYYGWLRDYRRARLLQPLPADLFPPDAIDRDFFPVVQQMRAEGTYWAVPTAIRSLGLFSNRHLLREAGADPAVPPATLDDFVAVARSVARHDAAGNLTLAGTTIGLPSQDSHWWREILVRQFGGRPYSDDFRRVTYGDDAGSAALAWYVGLQTGHHVAQAGFMSDSQAAFRAGRAGLHVNGSFLVGPLQAAKNLDWAVSELPVQNGIRANYASYWVNALAACSTGPRREAALKFIAYLTTDVAMALWLDVTGELPARARAAASPAILNNPATAALSNGLAYASTTDFVDEDAQRTVFVDMLDRVLIQQQAPGRAVRDAAAAEQKIIDAYYRT